MRKLLLSAASLAIVCSGSMTAAFADGEGGMMKNVAMFPVKTVAVASGMAIGVPMATVRRCAVRYKGYTDEMADKLGGHENFPPVLFASVFGIPAGLLVGSGEGVYYGTKNAINKGWDKPFCEDSFSLGELE